MFSDQRNTEIGNHYNLYKRATRLGYLEHMPLLELTVTVKSALYLQVIA